ncbi:MAG: hypothetical protein HYT37_03300 [Candidatus Sungbacteria bacterium]|nr:hypothetical protein [Candidatus Sungbacteria bacterium]
MEKSFYEFFTKRCTIKAHMHKHLLKHSKWYVGGVIVFVLAVLFFLNQLVTRPAGNDKDGTLLTEDLLLKQDMELLSAFSAAHSEAVNNQDEQVVLKQEMESLKNFERTNQDSLFQEK